MTIKVALGTTSELKIRATKQAFEKYDLADVKGVKTDSNVSDQPFGYGEIISGARNRARSALADKAINDASLGIGIESGLIEISELSQYFDIPCVCVLDEAGKESIAFGSGYRVPDWAVEKIKEEKTELGEVISTHEKDPIGYLSNGKLNREEIICQAVEVALAEMFNKKKYIDE